MSKIYRQGLIKLLDDPYAIRDALRIREEAEFLRSKRMKPPLFEIGRAIMYGAGFEADQLARFNEPRRVGRRGLQNPLVAKLLLDSSDFADSRLELSIRHRSDSQYADYYQYLPLTDDDPLNTAYVEPDAYALAASALRDTIWRSA